MSGTQGSISVDKQKGNAPVIQFATRQQPPPPRTVSATVPAGPTVERPNRHASDTVLHDVQQARLEKKLAHTYTVDRLRQLRHDRELASNAVFQFHAEIQLYRRYIADSRRKRQVQQLDMPVLQHRIHAILLQLNVVTYQQVFNEILSLDVTSDVFVLSFVNVVFKQAVLNPSLALLYAMLSQNVMYVMKDTPYAANLKGLFRERCDEAFVVPKADTDKGTLILLRGVVIFAGHLLRQQMLDVRVLTDWENRLMQSGTVSSLGLALNLFLASGAVVAKNHQNVVDRLSEKVKAAKEAELEEPFKALQDMMHEGVETKEQNEKELMSPEMKKSPSVDKELGGKYGSLFKKSSSIPVDLSQLAGADDEEESMSSLVKQYFFNPEILEFLEGLERLNYKKGDGRVALDLLRAIVEQSSQNIMVVWQLIGELWRNGFYSEDELKDSLKTVATEAAGDQEKGRKLALIYAQLVNTELLTLDDFEELFAPLRSVWKVVIHTLFIQMDQLRGEWIDDILDSEFWRNAQFLGVDSMPEKLARLQEWELLSFLPQYEIAAQFLDSAKTGTLNIDFTSQDDLIDRHELAPIIFEVIASFDDNLMNKAASQLKSWFQPCSPGIPEMASRCGAKGAALAALLKQA